MGWKYRYPHIPLLLSLRPSPRLLLGKRLFWTEKRDGQNVAIWFEELEWKKKMSIEDFKGEKGGDNFLIDDKVFNLRISSRDKEIAASDIQARVRGTEEFPKIINLLCENPQFVVYIESCKKGRSVTGIELYEKNFLIVFDIYDISAEQFLPYVAVHQHCFHHEIPVVKLWAETRHRTMKDLLKWKNYALEQCEAIKLEGMVIKTFDEKFGYVQAKVKLDVPEPEERKIARGEVILPPIPEGEIMGAIAKVEADFGLTGNPKDDMPHIAQYINEECKKHFYSGPPNKLFYYYQLYLERHKI